MTQNWTETDSFTTFLRTAGPRLHRALEAAFGPSVGEEATAEALAFGWEHWARIGVMDNPAGYLYRVGRTRGRRSMRRAPVAFPAVEVDRVPWVEPALPGALSSLSERQRTVVVLIHSYQWSFREVAELLGLSRGAVQRHEQRGLAKLRSRLRGNGS